MAVSVGQRVRLGSRCWNRSNHRAHRRRPDWARHHLVIIPTRPSPSSAPIFDVLDVPGLLDFGERQQNLAVGAGGRFAQHRDTWRVFAFELRPAQAVLAVLVIEQEDQTIWWLAGIVVTPTWSDGCREVLLQQRGGRSSGRPSRNPDAQRRTGPARTRAPNADRHLTTSQVSGRDRRGSTPTSVASCTPNAERRCRPASAAPPRCREPADRATSRSLCRSERPGDQAQRFRLAGSHRQPQ